MVSYYIHANECKAKDQKRHFSAEVVERAYDIYRVAEVLSR